MTPRSIALQGIGFGVLLLALQGFGPVTSEPASGPTGGGFRAVAASPLGHARQQKEDEEILVVILAALETLW